ncbi:hypothetical protein KIW84_064236 [Lathyrus oleraceus]|uniref:Uncharacterized protein n=1 Tax=Pisum sativum TaxID=3888 RepID=A0A9D4WC02_PEA|nr:hypothetical protein KIW84_064236 [Pisum sativum]
MMGWNSNYEFNSPFRSKEKGSSQNFPFFFLFSKDYVATPLMDDSTSSCDHKPFSLRKGFLDSVKLDVKRALEVLRQDGPGLSIRPSEETEDRS